MLIYLPIKFEFDWTKRFRVFHPVEVNVLDVLRNVKLVI